MCDILSIDLVKEHELFTIYKFHNKGIEFDFEIPFFQLLNDQMEDINKRLINAFAGNNDIYDIKIKLTPEQEHCLIEGKNILLEIIRDYASDSIKTDKEFYEYLSENKVIVMTEHFKERYEERKRIYDVHSPFHKLSALYEDDNVYEEYMKDDIVEETVSLLVDSDKVSKTILHLKSFDVRFRLKRSNYSPCIIVKFSLSEFLDDKMSLSTLVTYISEEN